VLYIVVAFVVGVLVGALVPKVTAFFQKQEASVVKDAAAAKADVAKKL
jgi:uncharacterized membrane-anchored protein YhcB (DUF1043 family)